MAQELYALPEGWEWKTLPSVAKAERTGITPRKRKIYNYVGLEQIESNTGILVEFEPTSGDLISSNKIAFKKGNVLYGKLRPYLNKVHVAQFDGIATTEIIPFTPNDDLDAEFLAHYMRSEAFKNAAMANCSGSRMPRATTGFFQNIAKIPVPPLAEQKRIVAQLDALFSRIDQTIAQLQDTLAQTKALWASALDAAFEKARSNFESKSLKEVSLSISTGPFGSMLHKADYVSEGFPLVNPINLQSGKIRPDRKKQVTLATADRLSRYKLEAGDIVTARRGEIGRCAVASVENVGWLCGTGCFFIRLSRQARPAFVNHFFHSKTVRETLEKQATGATIKNISNKTLSSLEIPIPPLPEQEKIVAQLDAIAERTQALEATTATQLEQLKALKASLLDAAFRGQL